MLQSQVFGHKGPQDSSSGTAPLMSTLRIEEQSGVSEVSVT